jgi:catechol 2,3-dioxygenase-like lactoylglutathione lyase family enzyme
MLLNTSRVGAAVAVADMESAKEFYERKLDLTAVGDDPDGGRTYVCGEQTSIHVFPSPAASASGSTVAAWTVDDLERVVDELSANGVVFEHYDQGSITTDARGIAVIGNGKSAWFKDPDGNLLAIVQP